MESCPSLQPEDKMGVLLSSLEDNYPMGNLRRIITSQLSLKNPSDRYYERVSPVGDSQCKELVDDWSRNEPLFAELRKIFVELESEARGVVEGIKFCLRGGKEERSVEEVLDRSEGLAQQLACLSQSVDLSCPGCIKGSVDVPHHVVFGFSDKNAGDFEAGCSRKLMYRPELLKSHRERSPEGVPPRPDMQPEYSPRREYITRMDMDKLSPMLMNPPSSEDTLNKTFNEISSNDGHRFKFTNTEGLMYDNLRKRVHNLYSNTPYDVQSHTKPCFVEQSLTYGTKEGEWSDTSEWSPSGVLPSMYLSPNMDSSQHGFPYAENSSFEVNHPGLRVKEDSSTEPPRQAVSVEEDLGKFIIRLDAEDCLGSTEVYGQGDLTSNLETSPQHQLNPIKYSPEVMKSLQFSPLSLIRPQNLPDLPIVVGNTKKFSELITEVLDNFVNDSINTDKIVHRMKTAPIAMYKELLDCLECTVNNVCLSDKNLSSIGAEICKLMASKVIMAAKREGMSKKEYRVRFGNLLMRTIINSFVSILSCDTDERKRQTLLPLLKCKTTLKALQDLVRFTYHLFVVDVLSPGNIFEFGMTMLKNGQLYAIKCLLQLVGSLGPVLEAYVCRAGKTQQKKDLEDFYNHVQKIVSQNIAQGKIYQCLQKLLTIRSEENSSGSSGVSSPEISRVDNNGVDKEAESSESSGEWKFVSGASGKKDKRLTDIKQRERMGARAMDMRQPVKTELSKTASQNFLVNKQEGPLRGKASSCHSELLRAKGCRCFYLLEDLEAGMDNGEGDMQHNESD